MSFKGGFLNRPNAFGDRSKGKGTTNGVAATTEIKEPTGAPGTPSSIASKLYEMPRNFSTILARGPDAPPQAFRGLFDDPFKEYFRNPLNSKQELCEVRGLGHHVLLNLDLGPNAKNGESGREKIPTWITADQIEFLNNLVGTPPPCGVEEADRVGKMWGNIEAGPDLGGPRKDGEGVLWDMKEIPGKGRGLFALCDFGVGDLIISERPIQIMPNAFARMQEISRVDWFVYLHERRDEAQKKRFEYLYNSKKIKILGPGVMDRTKADSLYEGISRTNQIRFDAMSDESHRYSAVYDAISHVNHSCGPNTNWDVFDEKSFSLQLRACRPIKTGEELTAEYCGLFQSKSARQGGLKERYQFVCGCPWCSLTGDKSIESDINRNELKAWNDRRVTFKNWYGRVSATRKALIEGNESQVEILKAEGLHAKLHLVYLDLLQAYVAYSDKAKAQKYGQLALERLEKLTPSILEEEDVDIDDIKSMTEKPEDHWMWDYGYNRDKMTQLDVPAGKAKNPVPPKDYNQYMAWSMPDFSEGGPLRQAFTSMNDRQQCEYMKTVMGGVGIETKDPGGVGFGGVLFGGFPM